MGKVSPLGTVPMMFDSFASSATDLFGLALGWLAFGALHSLLASLRCKALVARLWPGSERYYRLIYNLIATVLLLPLLWATLTWPGPWLWRWQGAVGLLMDALALAALILLTRSGYDLAEFTGLSALRQPPRADTEPCPDRGEAFRLSPLHRHVRHPWYALALVLIWTRDMNAPLLVSSLAVTLYFIVGAQLEEKKLLLRFGSVYAEYRQRVPALLPIPWRRLSASEAEALLRRADGRSSLPAA